MNQRSNGEAGRPAEIEALGRRIQSRRNQRGVTLDVMAVRTGFSKGYLSRIENGKKTPPLDTLARIARALGTDVNTLLSDERGGGADEAPFVNVVRAGSRQRAMRPESTYGYVYERLADSDRPLAMQPFLIHLPPDFDKHVFFEHEGQEFMHVLQGRVEWQIGHERVVLEPGDSLYLDSRIPHRARALEGEAAALIVVTPRREPVATTNAAALQMPPAGKPPGEL
jgi:transcriptional regulator with XRE-family HTH domain